MQISYLKIVRVVKYSRSLIKALTCFTRSSLLFLPLFAIALSAVSNAVDFVHFYFLGESKTETTNLRLNDNNWHKVHLTRNDRALTITIDDGRASGNYPSRTIISVSTLCCIDDGDDI